MEGSFLERRVFSHQGGGSVLARRVFSHQGGGSFLERRALNDVCLEKKEKRFPFMVHIVHPLFYNWAAELSTTVVL